MASTCSHTTSPQNENAHENKNVKYPFLSETARPRTLKFAVYHYLVGKLCPFGWYRPEGSPPT